MWSKYWQQVNYMLSNFCVKFVTRARSKSITASRVLFCFRAISRGAVFGCFVLRATCWIGWIRSTFVDKSAESLQGYHGRIDWECHGSGSFSTTRTHRIERRPSVCTGSSKHPVAQNDIRLAGRIKFIGLCRFRTDKHQASGIKRNQKTCIFFCLFPFIKLIICYDAYNTFFLLLPPTIVSVLCQVFEINIEKRRVFFYCDHLANEMQKCSSVIVRAGLHSTLHIIQGKYRF